MFSSVITLFLIPEIYRSTLWSQGAQACLEPHRSLGASSAGVCGMAQAKGNSLHARRHQKGREWSRCGLHSSQREYRSSAQWRRCPHRTCPGASRYNCSRQGRPDKMSMIQLPTRRHALEWGVFGLATKCF